MEFRDGLVANDPTRTTGDVGFRAAVRGIADIKHA